MKIMKELLNNLEKVKKEYFELQKLVNETEEKCQYFSLDLFCEELIYEGNNPLLNEVYFYFSPATTNEPLLQFYNKQDCDPFLSIKLSKFSEKFLKEKMLEYLNDFDLKASDSLIYDYMDIVKEFNLPFPQTLKDFNKKLEKLHKLLNN